MNVISAMFPPFSFWLVCCMQTLQDPLIRRKNGAGGGGGSAAAAAAAAAARRWSSEVVLCPILYCIDVFSTYLGKILDFVVVHWSFIFVSHVSWLIVEFI